MLGIPLSARAVMLCVYIKFRLVEEHLLAQHISHHEGNKRATTHYGLSTQYNLNADETIPTFIIQLGLYRQQMINAFALSPTLQLKSTMFTEKKYRNDTWRKLSATLTSS